jgi:hypothetical protein
LHTICEVLFESCSIGTKATKLVLLEVYNGSLLAAWKVLKAIDTSAAGSKEYECSFQALGLFFEAGRSVCF